jgi:hypothetical protein
MALMLTTLRSVVNDPCGDAWKIFPHDNGRNEEKGENTMKHVWCYGLGLVLLGISAVSSNPARADSPGPYYATPAWDQQLPAATRFIVLSNWNSDAVLDRETGLVWEKSPSTNLFKWSVDLNNSNDEPAQAHCNRLTVGNRKGWRLPTVQELASLVDGNPANTSSPRLPPGHPFTNVSTQLVYLSANPSKDLADLVWCLSFIDGHVGWTSRTLDLPVWCVRGGQDVNPQ